MATANTDQRQSPPYAAFGTFRNFIWSLKAGIPARVDKSVMPGLSGGAQSHLLNALRFFTLIGPNGEPTGELEQLVNAAETDAWAEVVAAMVRDGYADILDGIDLTTATPQQIDERFRNPKIGNLVGSTADKAVRFLLSAIKEGRIDHSKRLIARKPRSARRPKQKAGISASASPGHTTDHNHHHHDDIGENMTVPIYFHGKSPGRIVVPKSITVDDCKMVNIAVQMVEAFAAASGPRLS